MPALVSLLVTVAISLAFFASSVASAALVLAIEFTIVWTLARRAIIRCLPERVRIEPALGVEELPSTREAIAELETRGFVTLGAPQQPNLRFGPTVFPLVHRDRGTIAAVYQLRRPRPRTIVDLVTTFANGESLTTSNAREAGHLPSPPSRHLQTKHDASIDTLTALHQEGVATLRAVGRRTDSTAATSIADFVHALARHVREQRDLLDEAPTRTTAIALWRVLFGSRHHERPLAEQWVDGSGVTTRTAN